MLKMGSMFLTRLKGPVVTTNRKMKEKALKGSDYKFNRHAKLWETWEG